MNDKIYNWRQLDLQSMDDILCAGNSRMSRAIQRFQRYTGAPEESAMLSHVAGVLKPKFTQGCCWYDMEFSNSGLYVEESTTMNKWAGKSGVQINPFDRWLENYDGMVWVKKHDFLRNMEFTINECKFWAEHKNDPYESGIPGFIELTLCGLRLNRFFPNYVPRFTDEPHCTELQSMRKKYHGYMKESVAANRLPPWMWWRETDKLLDVTISEPIRIK